MVMLLEGEHLQFFVYKKLDPSSWDLFLCRNFIFIPYPSQFLADNEMNRALGHLCAHIG